MITSRIPRSHGYHQRARSLFDTSDGGLKPALRVVAPRGWRIMHAGITSIARISHQGSWRDRANARRSWLARGRADSIGDPMWQVAEGIRLLPRTRTRPGDAACLPAGRAVARSQRIHGEKCGIGRASPDMAGRARPTCRADFSRPRWSSPSWASAGHSPLRSLARSPATVRGAISLEGTAATRRGSPWRHRRGDRGLWPGPCRGRDYGG